MPELAEIKRYSHHINANCSGKVFNRVSANISLPPEFTSNGFYISAVARGKELRLTLTLQSDPAQKVWVLFTHGLVGGWKYSTSQNIPKASQVQFTTNDGLNVLNYVDVQKMGRWNVLRTEAWGKGRGPDPVDEYDTFKANIMNNRLKPAFEVPIGELLLDQKFFNGIGNYLRAEVLCRAGISPFAKAFTVFMNAEQGEKLLQLCRLIPMEVLQLDLNKYGSPQEVEKFEAWLRCYGKGKGQKDKGGRQIWFYDDQERRGEPLPSVSEDAYRAMFPKDGSAPSQPAVTTPAPAAAFFAPPPAVSTVSPAAVFGAPPSSGGELEAHLTEPSWRSILGPEFQKPYWKKLMTFLANEKRRKAQIFPPENQVFACLNYTPFDKLKVVVLGQDPYHDDGQAHGLCFSVSPGVPPPPSLKNIYKELGTDLGLKMPDHGTLTSWAQQGVLLLNACLTVEAHKANSHAGQGWEEFTDAIIRAVSERKRNVVFILWGGFAQKKGKVINRAQHLVLEGAHPSPLSCTKFFGCKHFSQTNAYLQQNGLPVIDWSLPARPSLIPTATPAPAAAPGFPSASAAQTVAALRPIQEFFTKKPTISVQASASAQLAAPTVPQGMWKCECCEADNVPSVAVCSVCLANKPSSSSSFSAYSSPARAPSFGSTQAFPSSGLGGLNSSPAAAAPAAARSRRPVDREATQMVGSHHVYVENSEAWDAMLNQTNISANNNKFYVLQLLETDTEPHSYVLWSRWGRVGEKGQTMARSFGADLAQAKREFEHKFMDKTANAWAARKQFAAKPGKFTVIEMSYDDDDAPRPSVSVARAAPGRLLVAGPPSTAAAPTSANSSFSPAATGFSLSPANASLSPGFSLAAGPAASPTSSVSLVVRPSAPTTDPRLPEPEAVSRMGRMLLLISALSKAQLLSDDEKHRLKDLAISRDRAVFAVMEAYAADEEKDMNEAADTLKRICRIRGLY